MESEATESEAARTVEDGKSLQYVYKSEALYNKIS